MTDKPKPIGEWADEHEEARFDENQTIARDNRTLRTMLRSRDTELEDVRQRLGVFELLDAAVVSPPTWITRKGKGAAHRAIPSLLLTDIHWGEVVDPAEIGGVNCYNPEIAEQRIKRAATGCVKLCRDSLAGVKYDGVSLMLGGDLVSGDIHDELSETNAEATAESVVGVLESLTAHINVLRDYFGKVDIVCVVGNHGRTTNKPRSKKRAKTSWDGLVYAMLAKEFRGDDDVTVRVAQGADQHFSVYDLRYCLTHGDQFKGGSGISGALAPLMLGAHRKRKRDSQVGNPWDVMVMGHFHTSYFLSDLIVGGSVVGYNEYAHLFNLPYEPPKTSMWLNSPTQGIWAHMPVHLLDRKAEGW